SSYSHTLPSSPSCKVHFPYTTLFRSSDWSARNVAVRVDFEGVRGVIHPQDWRIAAYHRDVTNEVVALQWEGGADYAIHGHWARRSEEHTSELQSRGHFVCRLLL